MMAKYRLYYQKMLASKIERGIDTCYLDRSSWRPAQGIIIEAKNDKSAMRKAERFWQEGEFGMGRIVVARIIE